MFYTIISVLLKIKKGARMRFFNLVKFVLVLVVISLIFFSFAAWYWSARADAAENSVIVKGYTCPTEFDPDDLGWAMNRIERKDKKIDEDIIIVEHRRIFSYFPDPEQRIWVGIKRWGNPDCVAELFSYGSISGIDQKPVWAAIRSAGKITVFLLTDKGWERGGTDIPEVLTNCNEGGCNLVFALYRDGIHLASRALPVEPVKQFFHFWPSEPVE
jgi:hypothetical protein